MMMIRVWQMRQRAQWPALALPGTPGELTAFVLYTLNVAGAAFQIQSVYSAGMRALGATERVSCACRPK